MTQFNITVLVPVLNRPKNVKSFIESFLNKTPENRADLLFITNADCQDEINEINNFSGPINIGIAPDDTISWAKRINWGINHSKQTHHFSESAPWLLCCADDVLFHDNWFELAESAAVGFDGILGTNDLGHPATIGGWHSTHPLVSRNYVETMGTMDEPGKLCHEGYIHNYVDLEFIHTAMKRGKWKHEPKCIIEHIHPSWNKAIWDDVYQKGQDGWGPDSNLWTSRKQIFNL